MQISIIIGNPCTLICCILLKNISADINVALNETTNVKSLNLLFLPKTTSLISQHLFLLKIPKKIFPTRNTEIKNISKTPMVFITVFVSIKIYRIYLC